MTSNGAQRDIHAETSMFPSKRSLTLFLFFGFLRKNLNINTKSYYRVVFDILQMGAAVPVILLIKTRDVTEEDHVNLQ